MALVASRKKAEKLKNDALGDGMNANKVACIRSPAGIDIGAVTPEEIALSILADIVNAQRRGRSSAADADAARAAKPETETESRPEGA